MKIQKKKKKIPYVRSGKLKKERWATRVERGEAILISI